MSGPTTDPQPNQAATLESRTSPSSKKAVVIGLYGVPGSGKTFLLNQLKQELGQEHFAFYEGSKMIDDVVPGGLAAFQRLDEDEKIHWRQVAIDTIGLKTINSGQVAVVTGHFMFWNEEDEEDEETGWPIYTRSDLDVYSHIIYLDVPAEVVAQRRLNDKERSRPPASVSHIDKWQQAEKIMLRPLCRQHGILFSVVTPKPALLDKILILLRDFQHHDEMYNLSCAKKRLDETLNSDKEQLETVLVIDADKTLAPQDTGTMFWQRASSSQQLRYEDSPLKTLFSGPFGCSYTAFRQAMLLYEEAADHQKFDAFCEAMAAAVTMHPEFVSLLRLVAEQDHVGAVIISCGLRLVWEKVLEREGLSKTVKVIGGGRIADGFVVTATVKAALVTRLRNIYQTYVWAFGDSQLDLEMLKAADQAIVVVGEEQTRSKTMEEALMNAIDNDGLQARQVLLPSNASPRLDITKLPLIQLTDHEFIQSVFCHRPQQGGIQVVHATDTKAAKLLMTPMRDAKVSGPAMREAHRRVGWYLATEFLADMIGVEEYQIPHVQGHHASGYRLLHEQQTSIVALMRSGEPMALGVNDAFPLAMFIHASRPEDIVPGHVEGQRTIMVVDSVMNSGKTVVQFVEHVRKLHATIHIVIVAGVAHAQAVSRGGLAQSLASHGRLSLVALRLSNNKFTGRGTTDTGNRLYNTTHLP